MRLLQILTLPENLDPCDYLHKYGAEAFSELLATKAVDALDHAYETITRGIDVERDVHGVGQAIERLLRPPPHHSRARSNGSASTSPKGTCVKP